mmetsp:Transcript_24475/g.92471  ORF Transcript_24475/g.92471 Transcript_24475/m.92471 type:complete len:229 (+) Transcript_24475:413-1099(+)
MPCFQSEKPRFRRQTESSLRSTGSRCPRPFRSQRLGPCLGPEHDPARPPPWPRSQRRPRRSTGRGRRSRSSLPQTSLPLGSQPRPHAAGGPMLLARRTLGRAARLLRRQRPSFATECAGCAWPLRGRCRGSPTAGARALEAQQERESQDPQAPSALMLGGREAKARRPGREQAGPSSLPTPTPAFEPTGAAAEATQLPWLGRHPARPAPRLNRPRCLIGSLGSSGRLG